jgi:ABC-2 type transport system permease protein
MTAVVANELLKLRTVRTPWLLLAAAQVVILIGVAGAFTNGNAGDAGIAGRAVAHLGLTALFPLVLGIMAVAGEHRHRTITDTYLATPRRGRVVAAKLAVYTAVGVVFGVVGSLVALGGTWVASAADGTSVDWSDAELWRTVVGGLGWNAVFAAIGVGVGALVRNLTAAVVGALAWIALVEGVVGQLLGSDLTRWLPFAAGTALGRLPVGGDGLSQQAAGALLAGYAVALAALALVTSVRRDVG